MVARSPWYRLRIETCQFRTGLLLQHSPTSLTLYRVRTFNGQSNTVLQAVVSISTDIIIQANKVLRVERYVQAKQSSSTFVLCGVLPAECIFFLGHLL